jgi:hypothetical protein
MRCNRQVRRFKTETVEYLKTRKKLLTVEHGKSLRTRNVQVIRLGGWQKGIQDFGLVYRQNNRSLARIRDYGS